MSAQRPLIPPTRRESASHRHLCRLLALSMWVLGFMRGSDATRMATLAHSATWTFIECTFSVALFGLGVLFWAEGKA